jgi:DNA-directed RNA polymerase specialized sigma24 family protein
MVTAQSEPAGSRVSDALMMLDMEQREVLLALHYGRLTVAEVAEQFGISPAMVSHRALAALRTFRRLLDQSAQVNSGRTLNGSSAPGQEH